MVTDLVAVREHTDRHQGVDPQHFTGWAKSCKESSKHPLLKSSTGLRVARLCHSMRDSGSALVRAGYEQTVSYKARNRVHFCARSSSCI